MSPQEARTTRSDLALLAVAVTWGGSYLAAQVMTHVAGPGTVLALRFLPSVAVLAVVALARHAYFSRRVWFVGVVLGCLQATTLTLETTAVTRTSATNAGVLVCLAIVVAPALEGLVSGARLPRPYYLATAGAIAGVALLLGPEAMTRPNLGDLLVLVAACSRATMMVVSGHLTRGHHFDAVALNVVQNLFNAVLFTAVAGPALGRVVAHLDAGHWAVVAFLSLGCTCAAFLVQLWAIHHTSATRASLLMGTEPVWALAAGVLLAGDRPGLRGLVGAAVVIGATWWGQRIEGRWRQMLSTDQVMPVEEGQQVR